jgi:Domain of unknown function (DUF4167)
MQNGPKIMTNTNPRKSARPFAHRSKQWTSNSDRPDFRKSQNAQRNYERYLVLAQAQAQSGDLIGAENYYQHAEHYYRSISSDREAVTSKAI